MKRHLATTLYLIASAALAGPVFHVVCSQCQRPVRNASVASAAKATDTAVLEQHSFRFGGGERPFKFFGVFYCTNCPSLRNIDLMVERTGDFIVECNRIHESKQSQEQKQTQLIAQRSTIVAAFRALSKPVSGKGLRAKRPCPKCGHLMHWVHVDFAGSQEGKSVTSTNPIALPCPHCNKTGLVVRVTHHFD